MVDDCPTDNLYTTAVANQDYYINTAALVFSIPDFTSDLTSAICGAFVYTATKSDNSPMDTFFTFNPTPGSLSITASTSDFTKLGTYIIKITGYQGIFTANTISISITVNLVTNCDTAVLTVTAVPPKTYQLYDPTSTVNIPGFVSSESNAICGSFVYTIQNTADSTAIDSAVFIFTPGSPSTLQI